MRFIIALLALATLLPPPAEAQSRRDRERERERAEMCRGTLLAAGDASYLLTLARHSAIKRWQEQVVNIHGERFMNYDNARGPDGGPPLLRCDPARVGGGEGMFDLKRCVITARPCKDPNDRDISDRR